MDINAGTLIDVFHLYAKAVSASVSNQDTLISGQRTTDHTNMLPFIEIMISNNLLAKGKHLLNALNILFGNYCRSLAASDTVDYIGDLLDIEYLRPAGFHKDVTREKNS